jgi:uncharacterized protein (DUF305 family)
MIPHHQEAVDTASIIVAKTENAELKKIARKHRLGTENRDKLFSDSWMKIMVSK